MLYLRHAVAGLIAAIAISGSAAAGPVAGSDSVILGNVGTSPPTDLLSSVANGGTVTLSSLFWGNGSGDLANIPFLTPINSTTLTLTTGGLAAFTFSSADGSFSGSPSITVGTSTFTPQFTGTSGSVAGGSETVGLYLVGTFTPAGTIASLGPDSMSIALTLNENGITGSTPPNLGSFSGSFTVAAPASTPPAAPPTTPSVPEPMSTLLLTTGLLGLATIRWKHGLTPDHL